MTRLFLLLFLTLPLAATEPDAILGLWNTNSDGVIEIYKDGKTYAAKIVDIKEKVYPPGDRMAGQAKVDRENPDKSKHQDPIIGMIFMKGFTHDGEIWSGGKIYDPDNGKTYKCKLTIKDSNTLQVRGYIGFSLLGRTEIWKR